MATQFKHLQLRRAAAFDWTFDNPILKLGEPGYETDTNKMKIGDGVTAWSSLPYFAPSSGGGGGASLDPLILWSTDFPGDEGATSLYLSEIPETESPGSSGNFVMGRQVGTNMFDLDDNFTNLLLGVNVAPDCEGMYESCIIGINAGYSLGGQNSDGGGWLNNTFVGAQCGTWYKQGDGNTFVGSYCAYGDSASVQGWDGYANTAVGGFAMEDFTTGWGNTALGYIALANTETGNENIGIGYAAYAGPDADYCIIIGNGAGGTNVGDGNVFIGHSIDDIISGDPVTGAGTGKLCIGNNFTSGTQIPIIWGDFVTREVKVFETFHVSSFAYNPYPAAPTITQRFTIDKNVTAGETPMMLWDITAGTLKRVSVGAADSGGSGFKLLRIPN